MKQFFTLLGSFFIASSLLSQDAAPDTLRNHEANAVLENALYTGTGQWGYQVGMNHKHQEEFGERYEISEHGDVVGVIVHVTGKVAHDNKEAHVRIRSIAQDGKPGAEVQHGHVHFDDFNLDGSATIVMLDAHAHVHDGFFATLDFGDYAHGGYEGDTIGISHAVDGSRKATDLSTPYRNVIREHSHNAVSWIDFYTGNNTPSATHFAIYPIIEFEDDEDTTTPPPPAAGINEVSNGILSFSSPYPNPAIDIVSVPFRLNENSQTKIYVYDLTGKEILSEELGMLSSGDHTHTLNLSSLHKGHYIVAIQTEKGSLATKINKL